MNEVESRRLKILIVTAFQKRNTTVWEEARVLSGFGHHVEVLLPAESEDGKFLEACGIPVHIINIGGSNVARNTFLRKRYFDIVAVPKLRRVFEQFDVVHLNLLRARILGRLANTFKRKPVVVSTVRGPDLDLSRLWLLEMLTNRIDSRTVAISQDVKRYLIEKGLPSSRICVIHNGVDLKAIDSVPHTPHFLHHLTGLSTETPLIGMIAWFYPHVKGHEVFIRAACILHREFPNIHFAIVGGGLFGDDTYLNEMKSLTQQLGLQGIVHFVGQIDHGDIPCVLDSLKMLVVPSVIREGLGMVIVEAMARNVPVIASNIGGIPELLGEGGDCAGILVNPGDPQMIADAVLSLLRNPRMCSSLVQVGRKRVEQYFTAEKMCREYERLFLQLVESDV